MDEYADDFLEALFLPDPAGYLRFYPHGARRGYRLPTLDDKRALLRASRAICWTLAGVAVTASGLGLLFLGFWGSLLLGFLAPLLVGVAAFLRLFRLLRPFPPVAAPYPAPLRRTVRVQAARDALGRVLWASLGLLTVLLIIAIGGVGIFVFLVLLLVVCFILLIGRGPTEPKLAMSGLLLGGTALLLAGTHWSQIATLAILEGLVFTGLVFSPGLPSPFPPVRRVTYDPYPDAPLNPFLTLPLLQITFTPDEYANFIEPYRGKSQWEQSTWNRLPRYLLARCPFCGVAYTEPLDTHSLHYWHIDGNESRVVFAMSGNYVSLAEGQCPHLFAVQTHLNLNGAVPIERKYLHSTMPQSPYVMTEWLSDSIPAVAVIHSLPICRLEADRFVPRYLLYTLVYYAQDAADAVGTDSPPRRYRRRS